MSVGGAPDLQAKLAEREARFREIIESNADAIIVVDREGVVRYANPSAANLFGHGRQELIGRSFGFPLVAGRTTEVDIAAAGELRIAEMRVVDYEWEGDPAFVASLRDVTERKIAEENARQLIREQAARSSAEASAAHARFLASAGTILGASLDEADTLWNLATLCVEEVADVCLVHLLDDDGGLNLAEARRRAREGEGEEIAFLRDASRFDAPMREAMRTGESLMVCSDQAPGVEALSREMLRALRVHALMVHPLRVHDKTFGTLSLGSIDAAEGFPEEEVTKAHDLALRAALALENARLYKEAQQANRAKTEFLAIISHDLRTPLQSIVSAASLLKATQESLPPSARELLDRIDANVVYQVQLIDQLLDFARLDTGRVTIDPETVTLADAVEDSVEVVRPLVMPKGIDLRVRTIPELILETDRAKLRQILVNLLANAVKFTRQGYVELECEREGDEIVFHVRDTGPGISASDLDRVFEPYWRGRGCTEVGTGIGLSVARRFAQLLGGDVTVDSVLGQGTTFTVSLPISSP